MGRRAKGALPTPKSDGKGSFIFECHGIRVHLGSNHAEAVYRAGRVGRVWDLVVLQWQRDRDTDRPEWDEATIQIAKSVGRGETVCKLEVPGWVTEDGDPATVVLWLQRLKQAFAPVVEITLEDTDTQAAGEAHWRDEVRDLEEQLTRLKRWEAASTQKLHQALDAFAESLRKKHREVDGSIKEHGKKAAEDVGRLKAHQEDIPLSSFDLAVIEGMIQCWAQRPVSKSHSRKGRAVSRETAARHIKRIREFVRWLHKAKEWEWRKPEDYEVLPVKIARDYREDDVTLNTDQVATYTVEELAILWEYATPLERVYMLLGLNCGFGVAEVGTLKVKQIHLEISHPKYGVQGSFISRQRKKTGIYGEWQLWAETVAALRWYQSQRPKSDQPFFLLTEGGNPLLKLTKGNNRSQVIGNAWARLLKRIRKDHPGFRALSFNKLRKTSTDAIRQIAGGEVAAVFGSRGKAVSDAQIERYSNRPFREVFAAIEKWREKLQPAFATVSEPFPVGKASKKGRNCKVSLAKLKLIFRLKSEGKTLKEIVAASGVPLGTVRYHLDRRAREARQAAEKQPQA